MSISESVVRRSSVTGTHSNKHCLAVCTDDGNPLKVDIADQFDDGEVVNTFNAITGVASSTLTTVVDYTVPAGKNFYLVGVEGSGCNVSTFTLRKDSTDIGLKRSYWGNFNVDFVFYGLEFLAGEKVDLKAEHSRTSLGDFEGRIIGVLKDA